MAHHGQEPLPEELRKIMEDKEKIRNAFGDTGLYPGGQITKDDEGEIRFGIATKDGKVLIDFGKPVHWVGMDPDQAIELAQTLVRRAAEAKGRPITIRLGHDE